MGGLLWEVEAAGYLGAMLGTTMTVAVGHVVLYRVTWGRYPFRMSFGIWAGQSFCTLFYFILTER